MFYIEHSSLWLDIQLCFFTAVAILSKERALNSVCAILKTMGAEEDLVLLASRSSPVSPMPPPGGVKIVTARDGNPNI